MAELVASYRLQLTADFTLDDAVAVLDHLAALGVSHVYVSPVAEAIPGSGHGYDVVDHTRVRAELGGPDALARLFDAAADRGLSVLVDHVPNHVSSSRPELNAPWWEMLRDGPTSPAAEWFDVDWERGGGAVILPVLDRPLVELVAAGQLTVAGDELVINGSYRLPLAAGTSELPLDELLDAQHHRLVWWRDPERNVRRFFTIDDLVAVRAEVEAVAEVVDRLPAEWSTRRGFGGVRVDHVDGLADPAGYLARLRERIGGDSWLVVEKILAPGEQLVASWPVDGTTGYEFARVVDHLLVDVRAADVLERAWIDATGDRRSFHEIEDESRREVVANGLRPDLDRVIAAADGVIDDADGTVAAAIEELTVQLPRYRTYLPDDPDGAAVLAATARIAAQARPELADSIGRVVATLLDASTPAARAFVTRWQQLTGPAMAKGAEDRAFYRYSRLASLSEVGGDPGSFGVSVDDFHAANQAALRDWPRSMLAASTHDTKRSDDVRARSAALTAHADDWVAAARRWAATIGETVRGLDPATMWAALQTAVTCPGLDPARMEAFLVKAAREADISTSWTDPVESYERSLTELSDLVVGDGALADEVRAWSARLDDPGCALSLVATLLRLTSPGVPDVYQGTETFSYRLVDPDNRVPPEWDVLRGFDAQIAAASSLTELWRSQRDVTKPALITWTLATRRRHPAAFGRSGAYEPLLASGPESDHVVAYARGDVVVVAATRIGLDLTTTRLVLPAGEWSDVLEGGRTTTGEIGLDSVLDPMPVAVLERRS